MLEVSGSQERVLAEREDEHKDKCFISHTHTHTPSLSLFLLSLERQDSIYFSALNTSQMPNKPSQTFAFSRFLSLLFSSLSVPLCFLFILSLPFLFLPLFLSIFDQPTYPEIFLMLFVFNCSPLYSSLPSFCSYPTHYSFSHFYPLNFKKKWISISYFYFIICNGSIRGADLIIEVAHPCIVASHGLRFLAAADFMVGRLFHC